MCFLFFIWTYAIHNIYIYSYFLPGKFHGQMSLVGYHPWDHKKLDTTEHQSPPTYIVLYIYTHTHIHTYQLAYLLIHMCVYRLHIFLSPHLLMITWTVVPWQLAAFIRLLKILLGWQFIGKYESRGQEMKELWNHTRTFVTFFLL